MTLAALVEEMRAGVRAGADARGMIARLSRPAAALACDPAILRAEHLVCDAEQGNGLHLLHEEPDHSLAVFVISWLPGRGVPPHDHGTWAIVAGMVGTETNVFWRRLDDRSRPGYAELVESGRRTFGPGEVVSFLPDDIHSVANEGRDISVSLHLYGRHLNHSGRSRFDPASKRVDPYIVRVEPGAPAA